MSDIGDFQGHMAGHHRAGKLAVILHADVAGSTSLVHKDEHLTHERIQATFRRFNDTITRFHGRVRELRGDALLAEFGRVSDAAAAALVFQAEQAEHNARLDDSIRPTVRVGIAMGEVVVADGTVTGAGVVLAQRMEQLAPPGGVCMTGAVQEALPQRMPFEGETLGEHQVKGFDKPVHVYTVRLEEGAPLPEPGAAPGSTGVLRSRRAVIAIVVAVVCLLGLLAWYRPWAPEFEPVSPDAMAHPLPDKPSIAVLPFDNMSDDPEQEYFVDGMTEDLITDLSKLSELFVIARNSVFAYKDQAADVRRVARELGVRYVLEGSVRRADDQLRINAQLIDATTGGHLWAERYDRELDNIFALQDDITENVVAAMRVELGEGERTAVRQKPTDNMQAYEYWLRGNELNRQNAPEARKEGLKLFQKAVALDPNFVDAWVDLAWSHHMLARFGWIDNPEQSFARAEELAQKALSLDDTNPAVYDLLAYRRLLQRRHDEAIAYCEKALSLNPSAAILADCGSVMNYSGRPERGLKLVKQAMRLNPHYPPWFLFIKGNAHRLMYQYEQALTALKGWRLRSPDSPWPYVLLAYTYGEMGRLEEAEVALEQALERDPGFSLEQQAKQTPYKDPEELQRTLAGLRKAGMTE